MNEKTRLTVLNRKEVDWSYKISNARFRDITKTLPIRGFCLEKHFKYIAHICRLNNSALQKQVLFDVRCPKTIWTRIGKVLGVDMLAPVGC